MRGEREAAFLNTDRLTKESRGQGSGSCEEGMLQVSGKQIKAKLERLLRLFVKAVTQCFPVWERHPQQCCKATTRLFWYGL